MSEIETNGLNSWYAIRVQSKFETVASAVLRGKGYEEFLPLYRSRRRWSDRVKEIEQPLFPGYLFCRCNPSARLLPILTTPGVLSIVGAGKTPIAIPDSEIAALQSIVQSGLPALPWPFLAAGDRIVIEHGPLSGMEGITVNADKKDRLVVSVPMLQRSVAVEIDRGWIRPVSSQPVSQPVPLAGAVRASAHA